MASRHPQVGPRQPLRSQKGKKQPRALVALRAPPAEEEDPRVKCKDCGAFGHKATSVRCPMKHWDGALAPQPLGSHKTKENGKLWPSQDPGNPQPAARPAREKEQRPSQEDQQRQALLQRFPRRPLGRLQSPWKDQTESCDYVRHPSQPMPVYTTQRRCVADPGLTSGSPVGKPDMTSTVSPIHRAERSPFSPWGLTKGQGVPVTDSCHPAGTGFVQGPGSKSLGPGRALLPQAQAKHPDMKSPNFRLPASLSVLARTPYPASGCLARGLHRPPCRPTRTPERSLKSAPARPPRRACRAHPGCVQSLRPPASAPPLRPAVVPQAPSETPAQGQNIDLQPPHKGPLLNTVHTCVVSQHPLALQRPSQPLRMVLMRLSRGQWSSRLLTAPSMPPGEEPAPPAESPPSPGTSEGPCAHVPSSVLYEDLQVSSSSEDSDGQ